MTIVNDFYVSHIFCLFALFFCRIFSVIPNGNISLVVIFFCVRQICFFWCLWDFRNMTKKNFFVLLRQIPSGCHGTYKLSLNCHVLGALVVIEGCWKFEWIFWNLRVKYGLIERELRKFSEEWFEIFRLLTNLHELHLWNTIYHRIQRYNFSQKFKSIHI